MTDLEVPVLSPRSLFQLRDNLFRPLSMRQENQSPAPDPCVSAPRTFSVEQGWERRGIALVTDLC